MAIGKYRFKCAHCGKEIEVDEPTMEDREQPSGSYQPRAIYCRSCSRLNMLS
jgi:hypothetical protein